MALLHGRRHHYLLLYRQWYSRLWRAGLTDRRPLRHFDVLPSNGLHVAVRQLEQQGAQHALEHSGWRQRLHSGRRIFHAGLWYLWLCHGYHQSLQRVWWLGGLVLRGQL